MEREFPDLPARLPGLVKLVGAGLPGKLYCARVNELGSIARDVGSITDVWADLKARDNLDFAACGRFRSDLAWSESGWGGEPQGRRLPVRAADEVEVTAAVEHAGMAGPAWCRRQRAKDRRGAILPLRVCRLADGKDATGREQGGKDRQQDAEPLLGHLSRCAPAHRRQRLRRRPAAPGPAPARHQRDHFLHPACKRKIRLDKRRYRDRWRVETVFCRLKDFRRVATRYDKLARNFASALALAAVIAS